MGNELHIKRHKVRFFTKSKKSLEIQEFGETSLINRHQKENEI